mmetsp:Transcript_59197/g.170031  ORF Transcript_59197/g.170031 Transcript_59197/m.170031 type:complete len:220 (-) Transcript_59197:261-920(-)
MLSLMLSRPAKASWYLSFALPKRRAASSRAALASAICSRCSSSASKKEERSGEMVLPSCVARRCAAWKSARLRASASEMRCSSVSGAPPAVASTKRVEVAAMASCMDWRRLRPAYSGLALATRSAPMLRAKRALPTAQSCSARRRCSRCLDSSTCKQFTSRAAMFIPSNNCWISVSSSSSALVPTSGAQPPSEAALLLASSQEDTEEAEGEEAAVESSE